MLELGDHEIGPEGHLGLGLEGRELQVHDGVVVAAVLQQEALVVLLLGDLVKLWDLRIAAGDRTTYFRCWDGRNDGMGREGAPQI